MPSRRRAVRDHVASGKAPTRLLVRWDGDVALRKALAALPVEVVQFVLQYTPQIPAEDWEAVRPFVLRVLAHARATTRNAAKGQMYIVSRFGHWVYQLGLPLEPSEVLVAEIVESYRAYLYTEVAKKRLAWEKRSVATHISVLRRIGAEQNPDSNWPVTASPVRKGVARYMLRDPYSDLEVLEFTHAIVTLPKGANRDKLTTLIAVGLGCGPSGRELRALRGPDITRRNGITWARISGPRHREVPIAEPWASDVLKAARRMGEGPLFPVTQEHRNGFTHAIGALQPNGTATITVGRLRTTWMVHRLRAGANPKVLLMDYAGLQTLNTLQDLMRFLPQPTDKQTLAALVCRLEMKI